MNEMQRIQPSLHNKSPQKQQLTASKIRNDRIKIWKGVDGVGKFTVKSTKNPYKWFRSKKKRGLQYTMCQKLCKYHQS